MIEEKDTLTTNDETRTQDKHDDVRPMRVRIVSVVSTPVRMSHSCHCHMAREADEDPDAIVRHYCVGLD